MGTRKRKRKLKPIIKLKSYLFVAISDGQKRTYTDEDGLDEYPGNIIRDPKRMSCTNLYINGVLQPPNHYRVRRGELQLNTEDVPAKGAPVILQFLKLDWETGRKRGRKKQTLPSVETEEE